MANPILVGILFNVTYTVTFVVVLAFSFHCVKQTADTSKDDIFICYHTPSIVLTAGILSTVSDTYAVLLSWIVTRHLSLPVRQRIAVNVIFLSSLLIIIAACFRTAALVEFYKMQDPPWYAERSTHTRRSFSQKQKERVLYKCCCNSRE